MGISVKGMVRGSKRQYHQHYFVAAFDAASVCPAPLPYDRSFYDTFAASALGFPSMDVQDAAHNAGPVAQIQDPIEMFSLREDERPWMLQERRTCVDFDGPPVF